MLPPKTEAVMRGAKLRFTAQENFEVSPEIIRAQRELSYERMWKFAHDRGWFHIQFEDLSIIQFQKIPSPSFHFMECPLDVPPISEFLVELGEDYRARHRSDIKDLYSEAVETAGLRSHVTPIRYDRDFGSYRSGVHPAAHLHIGLDNQVRLALSREMTPYSFLLFVIRQKYPHNWELLLETNLNKEFARAVRDGLVKIQPAYWQENDLCEISLA